MRFLAALLIALALTTGSTLADAAMRPFQTADRASVLLVMGALRKYDGEWRVIDNDTHAHAGVQQVLCGSNGVLTIIFKEAGVQTGATARRPTSTLPKGRSPRVRAAARTRCASTSSGAPTPRATRSGSPASRHSSTIGRPTSGSCGIR